VSSVWCLREMKAQAAARLCCLGVILSISIQSAPTK
jgi:hypothetical protein